MSCSSGSSSSGKASSGRVLRKLPSLIDDKCDYCGMNEPDRQLKLCGNCRTVVYCSKECQVTNWIDHKAACKRKNPSYFDRKMKEKVRWFIDLTAATKAHESQGKILHYLIDSFRIRCLDEEKIAATYPEQGEVVEKFRRYLHAAKGTGVLPPKVDLHALTTDASKMHRLSEISRNRRYSENLHDNNNSGTLEDLRNLHVVICGPVKLEDHSPNIIDNLFSLSRTIKM